MDPAPLSDLVREHHGKALATLIRVLGDFDFAEDALQEAWVAAVESWGANCTPENPAAWLVTTARRKAIDGVRREAVGRRKLEEVARAMPATFDPELPGDIEVLLDDRLRLIFTCCHPALAMEARVALTLRTLCGLTTAEVARAFLLEEATLAQRIVRAKRKIRQAAIPYRVPAPHELPERLPGVLAAIYLVFNEGYASTSAETLVRRDLCAEAIRLGRLLAGLMPDEAEVLGLLALMLLHDSRRETRETPDGDLVLLEDQDRTRWDRAEILEGIQLLERALRMRHPGPYQVQAAIAAVHAEAPMPALTRWEEIVGLYGELLRLAPSPVIELNRAVAVAMANGPAAGLAMIDGIPGLDGYHLYHAARADLLRRLDRTGEAARAYTRALELATNPAERRFLQRRHEQNSRRLPPVTTSDL